jgi:hypothetical protein
MRRRRRRRCRRRHGSGGTSTAVPRSARRSSDIETGHRTTDGAAEMAPRPKAHAARALCRTLSA